MAGRVNAGWVARGLAPLLVVTAAVLLAATAGAAPLPPVADNAPSFIAGGSSGANWLPAGSQTGALPATRPHTALHIEVAGGRPSFLVGLGELAFRSPEVLGGNARRAGIRCASCHPGGDRNRDFFIPGLSGPPGTVDVSNAIWNLRDDDGRRDPLRIPSLRDVAHAGPYGFQGRVAGLRDFTRRVMVVEFQGAEPVPVILDALVAYESELAPPRNPLLGPGGRLISTASAAARRGEKLFRAACAGCHIPEQGFRDGRLHDVGSGGPVKTPTLLGTGAGGPYFHDGRHATLAQAAEHDLPGGRSGFSPGDRAALLAYLRVVGTDEGARQPVTLAGDLARLRRLVGLLDLPLREEDGTLAELMTRMLRGEVGRLDRRFPGETAAAARAVLRNWAGRLRTIGHESEAGDFPAAREMLGALEVEMAGENTALTAAEAASLYDPARLAAIKSRQAGGGQAQ